MAMRLASVAWIPKRHLPLRGQCCHQATLLPFRTAVRCSQILHVLFGVADFFVPLSVAFCTLWTSTLPVFSPGVGELRAGAAMAARGPPWGGTQGLPDRGLSPRHPCALPSRLLLQGRRGGGGGPILRAAGGHQAVHPDRLPGVDHPERGKPGFVS